MTSGDSARKRKRGIVLTSQGAQKLRDAIAHVENEENFGQKLTIADLGFRTRLTPDTVAKVLDREQGVDRRSLDRFFRVLNLELSERDYCSVDRGQTHSQTEGSPQAFLSSAQSSCEEIPDASIFYGRAQELEALGQWVQVDRCRLLTVLGMGGIGKTSLVAKLIEQITGSNDPPAQFQSVVWRSLRHPPTVEALLIELINAFSTSPDSDLPTALNPLISRLIQAFNQTRCLLILDETAAILQAGERSGSYREGFAGYGELICRVAESSHKSCLILISRERPKDIGWLESKNYPVRSLLLKGLQPQDGLQVLQAGGIQATEAEGRTLCHQYAGNPCALKLAATAIHFLFLGNITRFLTSGTAVFGRIYDLLAEQLERLSAFEITVIYWLAIHRDPVVLQQLMEVIVPPVSRQKLLGTLEKLSWRSLLECTPTGFTLPNIVMEYATTRFIEQVDDELQNGIVNLLNHYALLQTSASEDTQVTQRRLILKPIADRLIVTDGHWATLLQTCRSQLHIASGYAAGNLLHLLNHQQQDLSHYDFSGLTFRQSDLRVLLQFKPEVHQLNADLLLAQQDQQSTG
jgi:NB-ARC domain